MTPTTAQSISVPLSNIEGELASQLRTAQGPGEAPVQRAHMSNLVIYCNRLDLAASMSAQVPGIVAIHPARVVLVVGEAGAEAQDVTSTVRVWTHRLGDGQEVCCEQVTLRAGGQMIERLPFAVRGLLIGDLPTNLWWAAPVPPPLAGPLLYELSEHAQQIIYDSIGWPEPARGVAATAGWLAKFERGPGQGPWRVASDLNWRRLKYWRRVVAQALDPAATPGALESISEVLVEHGPHALVQAWELVSWLAARLGWRVHAGRVQPGTEISWQAQAAHGALRLRLRRLPEGPSEIRRLRIACHLNDKPGAFNITVENEQRLAVALEGTDTAPRTVLIKPQPLAELVGRQLSDRERDPVFRESMGVAQVLAQSVLG